MDTKDGESTACGHYFHCISIKGGERVRYCWRCGESWRLDERDEG